MSVKCKCLLKFFPEGSHLILQTQSLVEEEKKRTKDKAFWGAVQF